jgi:hypothetical protein
MDHIDNDHDGKVDCLDTNCMKDRRIKQRCDIMLKRLKPGYDNPKTETGKVRHSPVPGPWLGQLFS